MELFVIPTHRDCRRAVESLIKEIHVFIEKTGKIAMMAVIDNSSHDIYQMNHKFLSEVAKNEEFRIYHIGLNSLYLYFKQISMNFEQDKYVFSLLYPKEKDYGKIFNTISLVACTLGVDVIHRRDSDCFYKEEKAEEKAVWREIEYIGKSVKDTMNSLDFKKKPLCDLNEEIYIVGSDYIGNWDLDFGELTQENPDFLRTFLEINGVSQKDIDKQLEYNYTEDVGKSEINIYKNNGDYGYNTAPECGNICIKEIFRYLPNFIGTNAIGFDYHMYYIAYLCNVPIVYHNNKIWHVHDVQRYEAISLQNYWKGLYKSLDVDLFFDTILNDNEFKLTVEQKAGKKALISCCNDILPYLFKKALHNIDCEKREKNIKRVVEEILLKSKNQKYNNIGRYLWNTRKDLFEELDNDYKNSIWLHENWMKIISISEDATGIFDKDIV